MASPSDRFSRLEKVAVFLIVLGPEKAREILADVDLEMVEAINTSMVQLGDIKPEEKAAVMIEFAGFFYENKPLTEKIKEPDAKKKRAKKAPAKPHKMPSSKTQTQTPHKMPSTQPDEGDETTILNTLQKLRERVDPNKINWGRAGYDFGEGFKGKGRDRG